MGEMQPIPPGFEKVKLHLHAHELTIPQSSGKSLRIEAPLPAHMAETWRFFGFNARVNSEIFSEFA
jgi:23S rRNA pseudouridine955/2504/2580 synthase